MEKLKSKYIIPLFKNPYTYNFVTCYYQQNLKLIIYVVITRSITVYYGYYKLSNKCVFVRIRGIKECHMWTKQNYGIYLFCFNLKRTKLSLISPQSKVITSILVVRKQHFKKKKKGKSFFFLKSFFRLIGKFSLSSLLLAPNF